MNINLLRKKAEEELSNPQFELTKQFLAVNIMEFAKKACASISICKYQYISANAGIFLDTEIMARLSSLNLKLDIDTYIVGEEMK